MNFGYLASDVTDVLKQAGLAAIYYVGINVLIRLAGKRLAGQTATLDLILLISLGVTLQTTLLEPGRFNAFVFVVVVFLYHKAVTWGCRRSPALRRVVRGGPRVLVRDGHILHAALEAEGMSLEELSAGLRKLGHESVAGLRLAVLEETGHVSVVEQPGSPESVGPFGVASSVGPAGGESRNRR